MNTSYINIIRFICQLSLNFIIILFSTHASGQFVDQVQKIHASDAEEGENFGYHVQIFDDYAFVSAPDEGTKLSQGATTEGAVYVYKRDHNGDWNESQKLVGSKRDRYDTFGSGIERSGNTLIIGAHSHPFDAQGNNEIEYAGAVYIFELDESGNWNEVQKLVASDRQSYGYFGIDVGISGDYAIVGSYAQKLDETGKNPLKEAGAAYIFKRDEDGIWTEQKKIVSPQRQLNGRYGQTVFISGNIIAVGAPHESRDPCGGNNLTNAGAVYMYELDDRGKCDFAQKIVQSNRQEYESFGLEIGISANELIVGTPYIVVEGKKHAGAVYYFQKDTNNLWCEKQKIVSPFPKEKFYFGQSLRIQDNTLLVGSGWGSSNNGTAYLFVKNNCGNWSHIQSIDGSGVSSGDAFGVYVSISENYALVGSHYDNKDKGSAYIFSISNINSTNIACDSNDTSTSKPCAPCESLTYVVPETDENEDSNSTENGNQSGNENTNEQPEDVDITVTVAVVNCGIVLTANERGAMYKWVNCDAEFEIIPGETNRTFIPKADGTYSVIVSKGEISLISKCYAIKISSNQAEQSAVPLSFKINPNPNSGQFQIEIKGDMSGTYPVVVASPFGKIIKELSLTERITSVDLGRVNKGLYILKIKTNNGTKRIPVYIE
jgi:FG-GAP repeat/Secretion system C-terminal sorting domain